MEMGGEGKGPVLTLDQSKWCAFYYSRTGETLKALEREGSSPFFF